MKSARTTIGLHIRTFVAGLAISTVLVELTPVGPSALASEIGPNDFRISDMGPDGDTAFGDNHPAVADNPNADEYLVIWEGDDDTGTLVDDEVEIFGQRIFIPEPSRSSMLVTGAAFLGLLYWRRARGLRLC